MKNLPMGRTAVFFPAPSPIISCHGGRNAEARHSASGAVAVAIHQARRKGNCRRKPVQHAGLPRQCGRRRARPSDITVPLKPARFWNGSAGRSGKPVPWPRNTHADGLSINGERPGERRSGDCAEIWAALLDEHSLRAAIPGCTPIDVGRTRVQGTVMLGVGPVKGDFEADYAPDLDEPRSAVLQGIYPDRSALHPGQGSSRSRR